MVNWRIYFAIMFGALLYGPLYCLASESASSSPIKAMCFEHIGPQDKPMPVFCVTASGPVPSEVGALVAADVQPIQLAFAPWRNLLGLVEKNGKKEVDRPMIFGQYKVRRIPLGDILYLPPEAMREIALYLIKVGGLNDAQSQMLLRLKLRLGYRVF